MTLWLERILPFDHHYVTEKTLDSSVAFPVSPPFIS